METKVEEKTNFDKKKKRKYYLTDEFVDSQMNDRLFCFARFIWLEVTFSATSWSKEATNAKAEMVFTSSLCSLCFFAFCSCSSHSHFNSIQSQSLRLYSFFFFRFRHYYFSVFCFEVKKSNDLTKSFPSRLPRVRSWIGDFETMFVLFVFYCIVLALYSIRYCFSSMSSFLFWLL